MTLERRSKWADVGVNREWYPWRWNDCFEWRAEDKHNTDETVCLQFARTFCAFLDKINQWLYSSGNEAGVRGTQALSEALKTNKKLTTFDISRENNSQNKIKTLFTRFKNSQQFDGCRSICYGWSIEEKHRAQSFGFMLWLHEHRGWRCFSEVTNTSLFREQHEKRWSNSNRRDSKGEHNTHNTQPRMYWWMNQTALILAKIRIQRLINREQYWRGRKCCTQQRTWS